ncbi:hypothetical protein G6F56_002323 [Rhizopus delemar]|nr:hypothetical protein G6F56_002323 [Rhizopus delemar]
MTDLYQSQVALRLNNNPHPRGNAIRALIDTLSRDEIKRKKEQFEDRGKHTISDGYTKDELIMVSRYFLQTNALEDLRNRFDFLLGHSMLARGENLINFGSAEHHMFINVKCLAMILRRRTLSTTKTSGRTSRATRFKPNENEFRELFNNAFKSRISRLIQAYLKQGGSKSKNDNVKDVEQKRRKVPPGTFEALDDQYGAYWSANTCKRLKLNALSLYGSYVQNSFDDLLDTIKENQNNAVPEEEEDTIVFVQEEQIRSIVALLGQIVRKYLPPNMRAVIFETLNSAIVQYSDFAFDLDTIIPIEFQTDSIPVPLPSIPRIPTSYDAIYNDYRNLFSFFHLQVISTLNFGTTGVQSKTLTNHPLWGEIHERTKSKASSSQVENAALQKDEDDFDQQF